jgi:DNA mismatch endonuclease (patch repair protein)
MTAGERAAFEARHRSHTMAAVSGRRTDIEQLLAKEMWHVGLRGWRRERRTEAARPDFVFVAARVVVFVDGCFWHGCPSCAKRPATNRNYWTPKIDGNRRRDARQTSDLRAAGWTVLRFWGHQIHSDVGTCTADVLAAVRCGNA